MGVLLLLSQERWQKFVSFGFDHIISGFCYLIRQKFKLISFSIACWGVSCTVWSGFWQVFNGGKKRKPLFGSCSGGKEGEPFTWAPGATSAFQERSAVKSSHLSLGGVYSSGAGRRRTGPTRAYSHQGTKEKGWKVNSQSVLCSGPSRTLQRGQIHYQPEQKPFLWVLLKMCNCPGSDSRLMPTGCAFILFPLHSLAAGLAWWFTEHGNTCLLHI